MTKQKDEPLPTEITRMVALIAAAVSVATNSAGDELILKRADLFEHWIRTGENRIPTFPPRQG